VVAGTGGRVALPAAFRGARRAGVPFVFWAAFWRHPRTPAHLAGFPLMLRIYSQAAAVVTYGEHVSGYVASRGARNVHIAPQAVENEFWSERAGERADGPFRALFAGRAAREKGLHVLLEAWRIAGLAERGATLVLAGGHAAPSLAGVSAAGTLGRAELRNFYASGDVLVIPSIPTRGFIEPWGLVANEAMNQGTAIIASDAVGAAAGGLVRDGRNGLIVPAGDAHALAAALRRLAEDRPLARSLGAAGRRDVAAFTHAAWADGFAAALRSAVAGPC
jgi:glycosyltransferase involved in cell wall biosynthesis